MLAEYQEHILWITARNEKEIPKVRKLCNLLAEHYGLFFELSTVEEDVSFAMTHNGTIAEATDAYRCAKMELAKIRGK